MSYISRQRKFYIITLGCKVNQYESESIREAWLSQGLVQTQNLNEADVILVNSCAITAKAVADVRYAIRQAHRLAPEAKIILTGCAARLEGEEFDNFEGLKAIIPQGEKDKLLEFGNCDPQKQTDEIQVQEAIEISAPRNLPIGNSVQKQGASGQPSEFQAFSIDNYDRSRAVVKVQDGCSHRCTYCIVPLTRGPACSRHPEAVLAEIKRLLEAGFREIGLSGVNLRQYGNDFVDKLDFWDLLIFLEKHLAQQWAGLVRLRLSSLEPGQLNNKALDVFCTSRLLAPHLHLSLQSGSESVLKRMGRGHYTPDMALSFTQSLRKHWPVLGLGADILTGFPGETAEEFSATFNFCREIGLTYAHVFPYSRRPKTLAAQMKDQIPADMKKERARILRAQAAEMKQVFVRTLLDIPEHFVVVEQEIVAKVPGKVKLMAGVNAHYADCEIICPQEFVPARGLVLVKPVGATNGRLRVELLS